MKIQQSIFVFLIGLLFLVSVMPGKSQEKSHIFLTGKEAQTLHARFADSAKDQSFQTTLRRYAEEQKDRGPWSVTDYPSRAASGNPHDYYSEGPYWWPHPDNPAGPYIRRDGEVNPAHFVAHRNAMRELTEAVFTLSLAAYFLEEPAYGERAAKLLSIWFVDEKTRMTPHLEYGQAIHGRTEGRGIGIIDTRRLTRSMQGLTLLRETPYWKKREQEAVNAWFTKFLAWMTHSKKGLDEKTHGNNHSTWWAAQVAAMAVYLDDRETQAMVWDFYRDFLVPKQIEPDGSCPREEARTKSLSYSIMNLNGFAEICRMAQTRGVDLWRYQTPKGAGMQKAVAYLAPYAMHPERWEKKQIAKVHKHRQSFLAFAGIGLDQPQYIKMYKQLPKESGTFNWLVDLLVEKCY